MLVWSISTLNIDVVFIFLIIFFFFFFFLVFISSFLFGIEYIIKSILKCLVSFVIIISVCRSYFSFCSMSLCKRRKILRIIFTIVLSCRVFEIFHSFSFLSFFFFFSFLFFSFFFFFLLFFSFFLFTFICT